MRLNLDCADLCGATARILTRQQEPDLELLRRQTELVVFALRLCAEECGKHAATHAHCRVCMEACRRCERACERLLEDMSPPPRLIGRRH